MNPMSVSSSEHRLPRDLGSWVRYFQLAEIPVLPATAHALEELHSIEEDVDARMITEVVNADPLMSLKVLAYIASHHRGRRLTDVETIGQALVLLGITPFFNIFSNQPTVDMHLADQPEALEGLMSVVRRAHRASRFALGFAVHRLDHDVEVIQEAALLHDFAEMLLWLHAPSAALTMRERQAADPTLRSITVQREVLGVALADVQLALMQNWRLPELLIHITDDRREQSSQVRNVALAIRLARHTSQSWENAAVPDDVRDISQLLNIGLEPTMKLLLDLDQDG